MGKPILCLDFDGVIHSYTSGWQGADVIPDPPVPGALTAIVGYLRSFRVAIYSSRSGQNGGVTAMREWLANAFMDDVHFSRAEALAIAAAIEWPTEKPPAMVTIDDRAITFTGEWPEARTLLAFKPWNKV